MEGRELDELRTVVFVCVHNAGRSQMAEAFLNRFASDSGVPVQGLSAGTLGGKDLNPMAVSAMAEVGIDLKSQHPKLLTAEMVSEADRIITMGCGVDADACPAKFYVTEDWGLDDPAGQPLEKVREIRDQISERVKVLLEEIGGRMQVASTPEGTEA